MVSTPVLQSGSGSSILPVSTMHDPISTQDRIDQLKYYRLVVDFSHTIDSREEFEKLFDRVVEGVMKELDPHGDGREECEREVWVIGKDVTDEYADFEEGIVEGFKQELEDPTVITSFIEGQE